MTMANVALLALSFVSVSATPLSSVMDRIASRPGSEHVVSTMREIEISDRNMDTWWGEFAEQISLYKQNFGNLEAGTEGIKTESTQGDEIVCKDDGYVSLLNTLGEITTQWNKVLSGWTEKKALLDFIWNHLTTDVSNDESGLHCKDDGTASGDAQSLCNFIKGLMDKATGEKTKLDAEEKEVDGYKTDINNYKCDCKMSDTWLEQDFTACAGEGVTPKTIYRDDCDVNQKHDEVVNCEPIQSSCGTGTQSKTRKRLWDIKTGDASDVPVACPTGTYAEGGISGTLSDIVNDIQTWTVTCKAGEHNGECPEDCAWSAWDPTDIDNAACGATSCDDKKDNKQKATRKKTSIRKWGGAYCFQDEEGDYGSKVQDCSYETRAEQVKLDLEHQITEWKRKVGTLTAAMCKDNGPCKNGATCEVELNEKGNEVTKWCTCASGYTGTFCEED